MNCALCGEEFTIETTIVPNYLLSENESENSNQISFCVEHNDKFNKGHIGICLNKSEFIIKLGGGYRSQPAEYELSNLKDKYIKMSNKECERRIRMKLGVVEIPGSEHWCDG